MKFRCLLLLLVLCRGAAQSQVTPDTLLIHFDYNQSLITPRSAITLDSFLQANRAATITQVTLKGHCDFIGSHIYNDSLSQQRVKAAKEYLGGKGLPPSLFSQEAALGKRMPLNPAATDAARAINRRVELVFVKQVIAQAPPPVEEQALEVKKPALATLINDSATKAGSTLVLPDMNFVPGRHYLLQGSYPILQELLKAMQDNPNLQIEIHGHICCLSGGDGPDSDLGTNNLSVERAKAIYDYLVNAGISRARMSYQGFGSSRKLFPAERTPMEMSKNRRVEIKIVNK
ncbi:OmpA family protein [Pseudoflavitalea sp. X16]|uniref:OmpA family protein n=1 Tax=Paraflavitalea devenefica TaxID=2716334 RepID=UPI0014236FEB|nr:OmpA family protein [Paraflavitalea devenefica]NII27506.1 OmpA family protein [Paraflavitalea devenefica]